MSRSNVSHIRCRLWQPQPHQYSGRGLANDPFTVSCDGALRYTYGFKVAVDHVRLVRQTCSISPLIVHNEKSSHQIPIAGECVMVPLHCPFALSSRKQWVFSQKTMIQVASVEESAGGRSFW